MDKRLSRLLKLASRTGDRLVVLPESGGEPFVILPLEDYEQGVLSDQSQRVPAAKSIAEQDGQLDQNTPETSMLADNYEFEPVAYEEDAGSQEVEQKQK